MPGGGESVQSAAAIARVPKGKTQGEGPWARRTIFVAFREAAVDQWGTDGLAIIAGLLPPDARADLIDGAIARAEFFPEQYVVAWIEAVRSGPARGQIKEVNAHVCRMMACGFGRVRKLMLTLVGVGALVERSQELWEHDHNTGMLTAELTPRGATLRLSSHVYTTTPILRQMTAELLRYAIGCLRGIHDPVEQHNMEPGGVLAVHVSWS